MKNKKVLPALLGSVALILGLVTVSTSINKEVVNAAEQTATVELSTFASTSASMDDYVSYTTAKGGGTSNPAINGGEIRLYQNSAGTGGGTITITSKEENLLQSVTIGSSMATKIAYTIGNSSSKSSNINLSSNGKYEVENINSNSITFYCMGTDKNSRLYVNYLSVTYAVSGEIDAPVEVKQLVDKYVGDGIYTKKTSINLERNPASPDALNELAVLGFDNLFHASESTLKRTTYYNDKDLLMANYDGSIKGVDGCTNGINSGYGTVTIGNLTAVKEINKNAELGDMTHFKYNGETQVYDYIVKKGQHANWIDDSVDGMEGFYLTPRDFTASDYFNGWNYNADNDCYFLEVTNTDPIVADFVNVVAPLLLDDILESSYISVTSLIVKETNEGLVLQIIANGDTGKLVDGTNVLAEAIITDNCDVDFSYVSDSAIFNLGENGDATHSDGTEKTTFSDAINGYTLSITGGTKMYTGARDAKGNSCIKLGTGSAAGSFKFTVPENVNSIVIYVAGYKASIAKIEVNGTSYEIKTLSNNGEYTPIEIDTSSTKTISFKTLSSGYRCMINAIEFIAG